MLAILGFCRFEKFLFWFVIRHFLSHRVNLWRTVVFIPYFSLISSKSLSSVPGSSAYLILRVSLISLIILTASNSLSLIDYLFGTSYFRYRISILIFSLLHISFTINTFVPLVTPRLAAACPWFCAMVSSPSESSYIRSSPGVASPNVFKKGNTTSFL